MTRGDLEAIKAQLQDRIVELCEQLLPGGRVERNRHYVAHDPVQHDQDRTPALKVRLSGNIGGWRNFRGGDEGARHDVVGLVEYCLRTDTKGALAWARDFLGIQSMSRAEREAMHQAARAKAIKRQRDDAKSRLKRMERAADLWQRDTLPFALEDPRWRHPLAYFAARGVPLVDVPNLALTSFRFSPATEWWRGAEFRQGADGYRRKVTAGPIFPALHSAMRTEHGQATACHVTFLDPTRPAKAPVEPAKLVFGEAACCVIEISYGPEALPFWEGTRPVPVILCEGIETGFSLAIETPEARVWAAGSISNLGNAPVHLPCCAWIGLARDNNHGNPTAQKQIEQAQDKLEAEGKPLTVMASHVGDDFNDLMKGE